MSFTFKPAARENVGLFIGLAGGTGSGKTYTAMRLATGMALGKPFAVIDTEAGRAKHYADQFKFDHGELNPPFSPAAYTEAIVAADKAGYPVIVVDSASHEHAGDGGLLDMHEAEYQRMGGRDNVKVAAWIKPKMEHKKFVQRLLQIRAHIILCFRAEEKIEMVRDENGKMKPMPKKSLTGLDGWIPICEKNLPFEMTASFLLLATQPGIPKPIKLQEQHRPFFPLEKPITEDSGRRLAEWAKGAPTNAGSLGVASTPPRQDASEATVAKDNSDSIPATGAAAPPAADAPTDIVGGYKRKINNAKRDAIAPIVEDAKNDPDLFPPDRDDVIAHARKRYSDLGRAA